MTYDPDPAARALRAIRRARRLVAPLPPEIAPADETQGAAVQAALSRLITADAIAGFKIGITGKRMQAYLGLDTPAAGFMDPASVYKGDGAVKFANCIRPGLECEVVVRLSRALPPGTYDAAAVADAVGDILAGIEVVEDRYEDVKSLSTPTLIGDQVYHVAAVVGYPSGTSWRGPGIETLRGRIIVDGVERDSGVASDLMGHPFNCLAFLASSPVAAAFGGLKAGQYVMLGSVTPPVWVDKPCDVRVEFDGLPAVTARLD